MARDETKFLYKEIPGFNGAYEINMHGTVRSLGRRLVSRGVQITLPPLKTKESYITISRGKVEYLNLTNSEYRNVRLNLSKLLNSLFAEEIVRAKIIREHKVKAVKQKRVEALKQANLPNNYSTRAREVEQWEDGVLLNDFKSITLACKAVDGHPNTLSNFCYGIRGHFGYGYEWHFKGMRGIEIDRKIYSNRSRAVEQLLDGEVVASYKSFSEAAKKVGGTPSLISDCCNGLRNFYYGHSWRFKK